MGKGRASRRPSYTRCGDKRHILFVFMATIAAMVAHWRELPALWRDTADYRKGMANG